VEAKRKLIHNKESCPCRELFHGETLERWKKMIASNGYKDGEAVLRIKTDLEEKNPAVRDWPAFRIITDGNHPLKKAKVWPLLNFSSAIDDHELGITHIVRGIDLAVSDERQKYLYDIFSWNYPETIYTGKLVVRGVKSTSESKKLIDEGKLDGWDDIRLATLQTLRKRGFQKEAIHEFVKGVGTNRNNVEVSLQNLEAFNKDVIDEQANRYFFIESPITITIENAPEQQVELDLYPKKRKGGRTFTTKEKFLVEEKDTSQWNEGELIRLMDCLNFTKKGKKYVFHSLEYEEFKGNGKHIIHWLPKEENIPVKVRNLDNKVIEGNGEKTIKNVKKEEIVQFERFGFCKKNEEFWFTQ
jgi:glutamyl-tRNA synthetase